MYKIVCIGNTFTGKTSLLERFANQSFKEQGRATIGVEFSHVTRPGFHMTLWDTAGQERYSNLSSSYYRGAHVVLLVYAASERQTFSGLTHWLRQFQSYGDSSTLVVVVANKIDVEERQVSPTDGAHWAQERNLAYFEVSAKNGTGVHHLFEWIIDELKKRPLPTPKTKLNQSDARRDTCCAY